MKKIVILLLCVLLILIAAILFFVVPGGFSENFEDSTAGQTPAAFTVSGEGSAKAEANSGKEGMGLRIASNAGQSVLAGTPIGTLASGKISFDFYAETLNGMTFGLYSGATRHMELKVTENGAISFGRDALWHEIAAAGSVKAGKWNRITLNLPMERHTPYAYLYVNDTYVGMGYYDVASDSFDTLTFGGGENVSFVVDNLMIGKADPARTVGDREETDVPLYLPEEIESTAGYLENDTTPASGALAFGQTGAVKADWKRTSIGVDLGSVQTVNALRVWDSDNLIDSKWESYTLWQSDDNVTYTQIPGYTLNSYEEDGKSVSLFEFSGVFARYIKIHTVKDREDMASLEITALQEGIRAERRIPRQYPLAGKAMEGKTGEALSVIYRDRADTLTGSIGLDFGLASQVEAIELSSLSSTTPDAFAVSVSPDNQTYTRVDAIYSTRTENGKTILRATFDSVSARYIRADLADGVLLTADSLFAAVKAYSAVEEASLYTDFRTTRGGEGSFYVRPDGTLVMGFNNFVAVDDFAEAELDYRQSEDGGRTWGDVVMAVQKNKDSANVMQSSYLWLENGDLLLTHLEKEAATDICNVYMRISHDGGETFDDAKQITTAPQGYTINSSGNRMLQLPSGRILLPVSWSANVDDCYGGNRTVAMVWYSDDDGTTWHRSLDFVSLPKSALEPSLALSKSGDILMTLRTRSEGKIYQSISKDNGLTWTVPYDTGLDTPSSTNTVVTVPNTGHIALIWNNAFGTDNNPRNPLTVALSSDSGASYHNARNLMELADGGVAAWPVAEFYGRRMVNQMAVTDNYFTAFQVIDLATLYHPADDSRTIADLPAAATPDVRYDRHTGKLSNLTDSMRYSLDGGKSWIFAGGDTVYLEKGLREILVQDQGASGFAPSAPVLASVMETAPSEQ